MAKKKGAAKKKAAPKKKGPKAAAKQSKAAAERVLRDGPVRRAPRQPVLPGVEGGQIPDLDTICAALSEIRQSQADLRADEQGHMQTALNIMRKKNRTSYRQHGVELARVPGEEKLRVRTTKGGATAEVEDDDSLDNGAGGDVYADDAPDTDADGDDAVL